MGSFIAAKGSITVDGVSLTVNAVEGRGVYAPDLTPLPASGVTPNPVVHYAPALILRRRGERLRGLTPA